MSQASSNASATRSLGDLWTLDLTCDQITQLYEQPRRSAEFLKSTYSALGNLMFTEVDRRKAHVELTASNDGTENAALTALADYKADLGVAN